MALSPNSSDREYNRFDDDNNVKIALQSGDGDTVNVQHPLPTDGDSIYAKDVNIDESDMYDFDGNIADFFDNLLTSSVDTTINNPKQIKCWFKRSIYSSAIGLGCHGDSGDFSNVRLKLLGSGDAIRQTIDLSADDTKYTSLLIEFTPDVFNGFLLEFLTEDSVCLSNITSRKDSRVDAQLKAQLSDGTMVHIGATDSKNLRVTDAESGLAIAKGDVVDTTFVHKFGAAPDFDFADGSVTVWDGADDGNIAQMRYVYSETAAIDSISSSSAADVQVMKIQGLDANFDLITQAATLNGQNRVELTTPLIRIFRMKNDNSVDNAGYIYAYENTAITGGTPTDSTKVRCVIQPGNNQTLMAVYTIPNGYTGYMRDWYASTAGANKDSSYIIELRAREKDKVFQLKHVTSLQDGGTSYIKHDYTEPEDFGEMVDVEMRAQMTVNTTAATIAAGFDIVLVKN